MTTKGAASDPQVNEVLRRYSFFLRTIEDAEFGEVRKAHYCSVHHKFDYCEGTAGGAAAASSASYAPGSVNYRPGSGGAYATSPAKGSTPYGH